MHTLGKKSLLDMKVKISIESTIYVQEEYTLLQIILQTVNIYIIKNLLIIKIINGMIEQRLTKLPLLIQTILETQIQTIIFIQQEKISQSNQKRREIILKSQSKNSQPWIILRANHQIDQKKSICQIFITVFIFLVDQRELKLHIRSIPVKIFITLPLF